MSLRNPLFGKKTSVGLIQSGNYFCLVFVCFLMRPLRSTLTLDSISFALKAREEYRFAKYKKQVEWAITIIQRCYVVWKRRQYLLTLPLRLQANSMSPICTEWPSAPRFLLEASQLLKNIFHRWRVSFCCS